MSINKNIIFIGITGVGKTTIGKLVAKKLNREFIDLDKSIEETCGVDIATIFQLEGEVGFRRRETNQLKNILASNQICVLSLGGGIVLSEYNRNILINSNSLIIELKANLKEVAKRLSKNYLSRPIFSNPEEIYTKLCNIYQERKDYYGIIADQIISTETNSMTQVINIVIKLVN